jgi:hypothetical protein
MKVRAILMTAAVAATMAGVSSARATIAVGDTMDLQYQFPDFGSVYQDSGAFAYAGAGQSLDTQFGITTVVLNDNQVEFVDHCGAGCNQTGSSWNGPVLFDNSNSSAFAGWHVLSDTIGITSSYLTGGAIGVNWQGVSANGEVVVGVPETSTWAMMLGGFALLGFAAYRARGSSTAIA